MAHLKWTHEAESSLRDIYNHIARDRPSTAWRTMESILNRLESIPAYPNSGHAYPYDVEGGVRVLSYGQFQIAFRLEPSGDVVILALFHGLIFLPLN
jgi:plasmid stabilization system protein ParE